MKVYLELPLEDRALQRVYDALVKYKPKQIEITKSPSDADIVVLHVTGRHDGVEAQIELLKKHNKDYVMIQYVLRSSKNPDTHDWIRMWQDARMVWSYYYLPELCFEDKLDEKFLFYHAPLGVDTDVFYDRKSDKGHTKAVIATNSRGYLVESAKECIQAAKRVGRTTFFLGKELNMGKDVFCKTDISDNDLAYYYSISEFVSGLRRVEGFELPAAEGLMCGARPIMFDRPHYRMWFDEFAEFIPEGTREETVEHLVRLFEKGARPVTEKEIARAKEVFNWEKIASGFWQGLLL